MYVCCHCSILIHSDTICLKRIAIAHCISLQRDDLGMQPHLGAATAFREGFTDPCLADVQRCAKCLSRLAMSQALKGSKWAQRFKNVRHRVLPWFPHKMDLEEVVLGHMHEESCGACHSRDGTLKAKQILKYVKCKDTPFPWCHSTRCGPFTSKIELPSLQSEKEQFGPVW